MGGFGERLRREREKRGVSLEEIAGSTKIGTRSLRALEEDAFDSLPGGIFNRGFVRAYARTLGLDEERYLSDFSAAYEEHLAATGPPPVAPEAEAEKQSHGRFSFWSAIAVVTLAVVVGSGWFAWKRLQPHDGGDSGNSQVTDALASRRELSSVATEQAPQNVTAPSIATAAAEGTHPTASEPQNHAISQSSEKPKPQELQSQPVGSSRTEGPAPIRIELFAREESWISVLADGKSLGQGMLAAQKRKRIAAQKEVRVTLGNVAGVEVSFNGREVNIDGQPKQVKELTFTAEGLKQ
jgi:cytoskeleton protein RodZ